MIELDEELVKQEQADRNFIPEQVALAAYRIAEEALTNVVEHAKASKVTVRLDFVSDLLGYVSRCGTTAKASMRKVPLTGWGWERCKTTLRPWMDSVRSTAIQAWARRLRLCSRSRNLASSSRSLRKKEATDGDAERDLPLVP